MLKDLIREHARMSAELRALEERIERERTNALAALPARFGYANLNAFIRAVKAAAQAAPKTTRALRRLGVGRAPAPALTPAPTSALPSAPHPATEAAPRAVPSAPPEPTGTSLDDPANFGLLPDYAVLERGSMGHAAYIEAVTKALRFAEKVLHTSKVPAKIWREWRQFERKATDAIHATQSAARSTTEGEP